MHFLALYPIGMAIGLIFATIHKATEKKIVNRKYRRTREADSYERHPRAVEEEQGNADNVKQLLNGKCFDKAPNCNQELCQKHHISLWKKCKKTCGACYSEKNDLTRKAMIQTNQKAQKYHQRMTKPKEGI